MSEPDALQLRIMRNCRDGLRWDGSLNIDNDTVRAFFNAKVEGWITGTRLTPTGAMKLRAAEDAADAVKPQTQKVVFTSRVLARGDERIFLAPVEGPATVAGGKDE